MKKLLFVALVLFVCPALSADDFTVRRFAGPDGGRGYVDEAVFGSAARFDVPVDLASGSIGILYVVDQESHVIRKVLPTGHVSTFAGRAGEPGFANGRGGAARFQLPAGIAVDLNDNVYVADSGNAAVRKISPSGVVTTFASGVGYPQDVAVDRTGNVYVANADFLQPSIVKLNASGAVVATFTGVDFTDIRKVVTDANDNVFFTTQTALRKLTPAGVVTTVTTSIAALSGLAIDSVGDMYVTEWAGNRIYKVTQAGVVTLVAGSGFQGSDNGVGAAASFRLPGGITIAAGQLFVADTYNYKLRRIDPGTKQVFSFVGMEQQYGHVDGSSDAARFSNPQDAAVDSQGNVFVASWSSIRKITPAGTVSTFAGGVLTSGSTDGTGTAARFLDPQGIAIDGSDNLYVSDTGNQTIRRITPAGVVTTLAGLAGSSGSTDGTGSAARFNQPRGIAVHPNGDIFVTDAGNHTIRRITTAGVVTTFAGSAGQTGSVDATGTSARFSFPASIDAAASGNLYVADYLNHVVRKITVPGAEVTTLAGLAGNIGSVDGTGSAARFHSPGGLAVHDDVVYVVDANRLLRGITAGGVVTTLAGSPGRDAIVEGTGSFARMWTPVGVTSGADGTLYICDLDANNIRRAHLPGIADVATASTTTPPVNTVVQLDTAPSTATSWEWKIFRRPSGSFNELSATNIRNPTFTPDVADLYVLLLRAEGPGGVRFSTVEIVPASCDPLASVVASAPSTNVCVSGTGATASVAVSGGGTLAYQWGWRSTSGGAITSIGGATSASYVLNGADFGGAGTKYLVVTVTPSCGPPLVSNQLLITVTAPPAAVEISASSGVFANGPHNFASVNDAGAGVTYTWSITNGTINSGQGTRNIEYTAGASGEVTLGVQAGQNGCSTSAGATVPIVPRSTGAVMLYTVTPCRVFDTRVTGPALASNTTKTLAVAGVCGIPSSAKAAVINMTVVGPEGVGWLTVFPADGAMPATSTLNYATGRTRANNAVVPLSSLGEMKIYNYNGLGSATHFIIDVMGWFE